MKFILVILLVFVVACDQKPAEQPKSEEPAAGEKAPAESGESDIPGKVDPPIPVAEVAAGKWYCDMGTAHYISDEKGDGKCPVCNMLLKQKPAGDAPAAGDKPADGHNHDHGEGGHDHGDHKHGDHDHGDHDHKH